MKELLVWAGPVASAKSTHAMNYARRLQRQRRPVMLFRPSCSLRAHERIGVLRTKAGHEWPAVEVAKAAHIEAAVLPGIEVLWIDEPMLFDDEPDVYDVVQSLRRNYIILLSGLPATSELEPFGTSFPRLIAVADDVSWCKADCDFTGTMRTATRSVCLLPKEGQKLVGGEETYRPASPEAWNEHMASLPAAPT